MRVPTEIKDGTRAALVAVLEGQVMLGVEENIIHPPTINLRDLKYAYDELCLWRWDVRLPGGRGKLTKAGMEALNT